MPSVYVHLSGRDTDSTILELYGINVRSSENQLETEVKKCPSCGRANSPNARFCSECNTPLDSFAVAGMDKELREQDELTRRSWDSRTLKGFEGQLDHQASHPPK